MEYWYPESRPKRQVAAVFDINKCIACQSCTMACKTTWTSGRGQEYMWWNNVETKPWGSYPLAWDINLLSKLGPQVWENGVYKGKTIFEVSLTERYVGYLPLDQDWASPNIGEDETSGILDAQSFYQTIPHHIWNFYLARICNHCTYPACLAACPRLSIYKRPEDGIVLIDQQRCRGYRECVRACPYKKAMYNNVTRISEKCIFCYPAIERGEWPRCMRNCIGKIRMVGFVNAPEKADPENPIDFLVHIKKVALPLYPQFGTEPNVYYIPPIHVSNIHFLKQMFGPNVQNAIKVYNKVRVGEEPEVKGILLLNVSTSKLFVKFKVTEGDAIGYDEKGHEVVRVPLKEPTVVRPFYDEKLGVYRHNVT
jgi:nitrate reductase beta subunit